MRDFVKIYKRWEDGTFTTKSCELINGGAFLHEFNDTGLAYNEITNVIYYYCNETVEAPYISENGKFCRFIDNKIVEIG